MEALEYTFSKVNVKAPTIGTYTGTHILIHGKVANQRFRLQSGTYIERAERDITPTADFHVFRPKPHEKVISLQKDIADEGASLPVKIFVGELPELMLAELYYTFYSFRRTQFNYANRYLSFGDATRPSLIISKPDANNFKVETYIYYPISTDRFEQVYINYTNEYKLLDKLLQKIKLNPPPNPSSNGDIQTMLKKYFPLQPYKG
jgi:hypothetical protein